MALSEIMGFSLRLRRPWWPVPLLLISLSGCGPGAVILIAAVTVNNATVEGHDDPPPLREPAGVAAISDASNQVTITWNNAASASSYNLYWDTSPGVTKVTGSPIPGVTSPFTHSSLNNGVEYYYVVTSVRGSAGTKESTESLGVSAMPLNAPTGLTATSGISSITLDWNPVPGASSYILYWSTTPGVTKSTGAAISIVSPPFTHTGLATGTTYYYIATAMNSVGGGAESSPSPEAAAAVPPDPPIVLSATGGTSEVTIDWAPVSGATSYNIYWDTVSGVTKAGGTQIAGATAPHVHAGRSNGTEYYYVITALLGTGESVESVEVSAQPIDAPSGVLATAGMTDVTVSWTQVTGASSYNLYWANAPGVTKGSGTQIAGITSPFVHMGLTDGVTYYYVVTALNTFGGGAESAESSEVAGTPNGGGIPDTTFGGVGWVHHHNAAGGDWHDQGFGITVDTSGKIIAAGQSQRVGANEDMAVWRYNSDGTLDTTFNGQGWFTQNGATGESRADWARGVALDSSGKILVSGASQNLNNYDMVVWRFNTDGTLDPFFNSQGWVVHDGAAGGSGQDYGTGIAIQSSGRILITGNSGNSTGDQDMVIWGYDATGMLDPTFGSGGLVIEDNTAGGGLTENGNAITLDGMGRILVTGRSVNSSSNTDMVIWRYDANGLADPAFGSGGAVIHDGAAGGSAANEVGSDITVDGIGRILVTGSAYNAAGDQDMALWRYDSTGALDLPFGFGGVVTHHNAAGADGHDGGQGLIVDGVGRIVVSGWSRSSAPGNYDMVIWRYDSSGALDPGFGSAGIVVHHDAAGGNFDDLGGRLILDSSDRIVVGGYSHRPDPGLNYDMTIWRFR